MDGTAAFTMAAAAKVISNRDEVLQEALQYVPNMFEQEDFSIDAVRNSKIFMVNNEKTLPIHPQPNQDNIVSMWLSSSHVVVADPSQTNPDNGLYVRTVLPPGWIHKSCIENTNENILSEVTPKTFEKFYPSDNENNGNSYCCSCWNNCITKISLQIRKHPIYILIFFLILHFLAECIIFADLITDLRVAWTLSDAGQNWLFMFTWVFILAPYYIAWAAAFGYLQKRAMDSTAQAEQTSSQQQKQAINNKTEDDDEEAEDNNKSGSTTTKDQPDKSDKDTKKGEDDDEEEEDDVPVASTAPDRKIQLLILLFSIAPIGVFFLILLDIYLLIEDLIIKPVYLCLNGNKEMREESHAEQGYKKLRRVSEVVAETICQFVLQLFIYIRFSRQETTQVDVGVVLASLITSLLVLIIWGIVLKIESKSFGLHFYEYVTVVLQGSFNFVPYLPAIERGKREKVNWTNFRFDSHSVGLVSKALISPECELKTIKLSGYSLSKLTRHECRFLGQMLADSPKNRVEVIFSRSRNEVQSLFERFDVDNSRTFDFREFLQLCCALRQTDDGIVSAEDVAEIFKEIADRHNHEVYLTDLLLKINSETKKIIVIDYDSPVMFALKESNNNINGGGGGVSEPPRSASRQSSAQPFKDADDDEFDGNESLKPNLLTFMIAAKVIDEDAFDIVTTDLVVSGKYGSAIMMCEDRGLPLVIEVISANNLEAHDANGLSDPYVNVSVAGQVKRTQTMPKNLNPYWGEALLFLIPPEDLPVTLLKHDHETAHGQTVYHGKGSHAGGHHRRNSAFGHSGHHGDGGTAGHHGHTHSHVHGHKHHGHNFSRLEINIKVYDYDDEEDDDFMGSYKHFLKFTENDFKEHHNWTGIDPSSNKPFSPKEYEHLLLNRKEEAGNIKFRVYCGAIGWYLKSHSNVNEAYSKEMSSQPLKIKTT